MSGTPKTEAGAVYDYGLIRDALNQTKRPIFFSTCGHSPPSDGPAHPWVGPKCAELANACRISTDIRFWGNGTFGTNKAANLLAQYNGSYSRCGQEHGCGWSDPDLLFSYMGKH